MFALLDCMLMHILKRQACLKINVNMLLVCKLKFLYVCNYISRGCSAAQEMFQEMTIKVNTILREEVQRNNEDVSISMWNMPSPADEDITIGDEFYLLASLANDKERMDTFLDRIWNKFGHFSKDGKTTRTEKIKQELSEEVNDLDKNCLRNESCWSIVEKGARSVVALIYLGDKPKAAGSYLSHHMRRIFSSDSYILPNTEYEWPAKPFNQENSDELALDLNQYLMSMTYALSNAKVKNVSLLDLPAFGSMLGSFKGHCSFAASWSIQQNMAIYNQLMSSNNYTWSKNWGFGLYLECDVLIQLWKEYMTRPKGNDFPPKIKSNEYFNFTGYIKDDMPTFLAAYSASFLNTLSKTPVWSEVAKRVFLATDYSERNVKRYGLYDNLIMDCVYQKPLFSESDNLEGCTDLPPILTSNGLCYSFNGIDTSDIWRKALRSTDILQSFSKVFGILKHETKKFRGIGHSEGIPCEAMVI